MASPGHLRISMAIPEHCRHLAQAAFEAAQNPEYSWDAIVERFDEAFSGLA